MKVKSKPRVSAGAAAEEDGPRNFSDEFRAQALERMKTCDNVTALARELGIRRKFLYYWRDQAMGRVPESGSSLKPKPHVEK